MEAHTPKNSWANPYRIIQHAWHGRERLWIAYWLYWVLGGAVLKVWSMTLSEATSLFHASIFLIVFIGYFIWSGVAVWRCAKNSTSKWAVFARAGVVITIVMAVAEIYDGIEQS
jgi:hypothetical protein